MSLLFLVGRILFASIFIMSGAMGHLLNAKGTAAYAQSQGLPMAGVLVPLSGVMILAGGLMIVLGLKPKLGAWLLLIFLVPTTLIMHRFWGLADPQAAMMQQAMFMKNLALIGATLMFQFIDRWPLSVKP